MSANETIVALLTPSRPAAIAVVLVAGPRAVEYVDACFQSRNRVRVAAADPAQVLLGEWSDGETLIVCRTAVDQVEIHPHGGPAAIARVVDQLKALGCRAISWQEWTVRASSSPLEAAAQVALASAPTDRTVAVLLDQAAGALSADLREIAAATGRGDAVRAAEGLDSLLALAPLGRHLTRPWRVAVVGEPNVGKSSLINALLGFDRAIVVDAPGTTRDLVSATTAFDGWPVELIDTAGLRETDDEVEQAGIEMVTAMAAEIDLFLHVRDATADSEPPPPLLAFAGSTTTLEVVNKIDIAKSAAVAPRAIPTSATKGIGLSNLVRAVVDRLIPDPPVPGAPVPFNEQLIASLERARAAVVNGQVAEADAMLHRMLTPTGQGC